LLKKQGIPKILPDIEIVESFSNQESAQWIELSDRLFARVRELEELMEEVRSDLEAYRIIREKWQRYHEEWKQSREAI
jgi:DNA polymerase IIIc chi subunit